MGERKTESEKENKREREKANEQIDRNCRIRLFVTKLGGEKRGANCLPLRTRP